MSIRTIVDASPEEVGADIDAFLDRFSGPVEFRQSGRDRSRYRVAVGLLHGNEPSGLHAIHRWLRSGRIPAVDVSLFVPAIEAARSHPRLQQRMLPGREDLNRSFRIPTSVPAPVPTPVPATESPPPRHPMHSPLSPSGARPLHPEDAAIATEILTRIRRRPCEALVDLHNNTGHNPPYGVLTALDAPRGRLVSMFSDIACLLTDLNLGTLLEATHDDVPGVSIECGQGHTSEADDLASDSLARFLDSDDLYLHEPPTHLCVLEHPVRVRLRPGLSLAFADTPVAGVDLTLVAHLDRHNFRPLAPGTVLGWINERTPWPFVATDIDGGDLSRTCFVVKDEQLLWQGDLIPIMMTTNAQIAMLDCFCYLMRQSQGIIAAAQALNSAAMLRGR